MKPIKLICLVFTVLFFTIQVVGQLNITDGNTAPFNPQNLVSNVLLGSGVEVVSTQYSGDFRSVGFFSGGQSRIGIERGIVLSTGFANSLNQTNVAINDNGEVVPGASIQDPDLAAIAGDVINDLTMYTIKFIPAADTLSFRYVFASEEYPEFICSINDVFGFFISGPNPAGGDYLSENIALVPDPSDPSGLTFTNVPVSINTVHGGVQGCDAQFPEYYNEVPLGTENFQMNAYLDVFTAEAVVVPCEEYTIKLGVADASDDILNSAVFLEAKSFGTGTLEVELNSLSVDGSLAEGCGTGELEFKLPEIVSSDFIIDIEFFNPPNAATPDVDYPAIPEQLVIPAGSNSVSVPLEAFLDNESEVDEVIEFEIQVDICNRKRFEILIRDDDLFAPILPEDTTICNGEDYLIESMLDPLFILPDAPYFENTNPIIISPEMEAIYSDIIVAGVIPTIMQPNIIESVCIQGLEHRDLTDFDIYLLSPGGQILELSTDNGFKPNNIQDVDRYENTCFTPFATENINNGENLVGPIFDDNPTYTGEFAPEGVWSDLWDGENPTNGTWRLLILDDQTGFEGTLEGWSITFRSFYGLTYEWTSNPSGPLCENCEDIVVSPSEETEYTLKVIDSYGCERSASTVVSVDPSLDTPIPQCGQITENSIEVLWNDVANNDGYEIRIDEGPWIQINAENYTFLTLASSTDFNIEVRAIGPQCSSIPGQLLCRTNDCAQPAVNVDIIDEVSCATGSDGEVTLTATGNGPFTFEIEGASNNTGIFNTIGLGRNQYSVTDATGCTFSGDFEMTGPQPFDLQLGYRLSDPCNVVSQITGSVNVTGAVAPYTYLWSNGSTLEDTENLSPGLYQVTVSDANGCDTIAELMVPALEQFSLEINTTAPICKDEENGFAEVVILSGNGPFEYVWEDGSTESSNSELVEGNHIVTVTDALGCEEIRFFTVDPGAVLDLMIAVNDASCKGQSDGNASVVVTGGVEPYNYFWNAGTSNGDVTEGLEAGEFTLFVSDANNCMASQSFTVLEPDGLEFEVNKIDNECFGLSNAQINIDNVQSPNGSVDISWEDGGAGFTRTGLVNGTYCFTLTDGTVCELVECIEVTSPDEFAVDDNIERTSCVDSNDGSISLNISGGSSPYTLSWSGPDGAGTLPSDSDLSGLIAGEYSVIITDANNCSFLMDYELPAAAPIMVDSSVFSIACNGDSAGKIFFSASGGFPPFTYSWTGPEGFSANTNNIQDVGAGIYTVMYTDSKGCSDELSFEITEPSLPLLANVTELDSVCNGSADGVLSVNPIGGTGPYSVLWSDGSTGMDNSNLAPGAYEVTVTDSRSCSVTASAIVREKAEINIVMDQMSSSCFETEDGAATVLSIDYGDSPADLEDFVFTWNTDPPQNSIIATGLQGGRTYSVLVTDGQGCEGEASILIETPDPVDASVVVKEDVKCFGGSDGRLEISGLGGSGDYTYLWDGNANGATSSIVDQLSRGSYNVTVTDSKGCEGSRTFNVEEPRPLDLDFRKIEVSCFSGNDGRAEAAVTGGTIPYSYAWSNGGNGPAIENLFSDWYFVTVTDANGCSLMDSTLVFQPLDPISVELATDEVSCFNGRDGRLEVTASGGSGFYTYSIDGNSFSSTSVFPNLTAGDYTLIVKDFKGCTEEFTDVMILEPEELTVSLGNDRVIPFGEEIHLIPVIRNAQGEVSYEWISANLDFLSCRMCYDPFWQGDREASYELVVTDEKGCRGNDFVTIRLENFSPLFVPTAFTPNNDGENDILKLFGRGITNIKRFTIFDRWGELIYDLENVEIQDVYESWDGTFKGKEAPSGVYYWFAEVEFQNGFNENFNGNTTLLR